MFLDSFFSEGLLKNVTRTQSTTIKYALKTIKTILTGVGTQRTKPWFLFFGVATSQFHVEKCLLRCLMNWGYLWQGHGFIVIGSKAFLHATPATDSRLLASFSRLRHWNTICTEFATICTDGVVVVDHNWRSGVPPTPPGFQSQPTCKAPASNLHPQLRNPPF